MHHAFRLIWIEGSSGTLQVGVVGCEDEEWVVVRGPIRDELGLGISAVAWIFQWCYAYAFEVAMV